MSSWKSFHALPGESDVGKWAYRCQFCHYWSDKEDWGPGRITCPVCRRKQLSPAELLERCVHMEWNYCAKCNWAHGKSFAENAAIQENGDK